MQNKTQEQTQNKTDAKKADAAQGEQGASQEQSQESLQEQAQQRQYGRQQVKTALYCMAALTRLKNERLSIDLLKRQFGHMREFTPDDLIRGFKDVEMNARAVPLEKKSLAKIPFPGIVLMGGQDADALSQGEYVVVHRLQGEEIYFQRLGEQQLMSISVDDFLKYSHGEIVLLTNANAKDAQEPEFGFRWFLHTIFKYKSIMRETLLASFFVQLFALVTPLFFMIIIDKVFAHNNLSTLNVLIFAMVVVSVFDVLLNGLRTYMMSHTTNRVDLELGMRLFKHMLALPLSYFESRRTGDTVARMREIESIRNFLTGSTLTLVIDLIFVVVFLAVMWLFSPTLALIVIVSLPLFFSVSLIMTPLMRDKLEDKHKKQDENQSFLVETIGGMETIKSGNVEPQQQAEWEKRLSDYTRCAFYSSNLSNLINQGTAFLSKTLTVILLFTGAKLVLGGDLSVGQLIAFNMLTGRVIQPIQRLAQIWQEFTGMRVSIKRVADILDAPTEPVMLKNKTEMPELKGEINLQHVSFQYTPESPMSLDDVSFDIKAGEVVGVVGSTGSGKTTLIKILQRLYTPTKGKILIDGINLVSVDGAWLRRQMGVVAQDFVLFNRSIRDNITLSDVTIEDDNVIEAAKLVGAHDMIMQLPNGYDTVLSERGRGLSTGQRQSIALARALVNNPKVLILDEATSALDYESEQRFQQRFKEIANGRTTFVVAHRLSTLRYADRILTIENGRLIENDSPQNLLKNGGRYAQLHDIHHLRDRLFDEGEDQADEGLPKKVKTQPKGAQKAQQKKQNSKEVA